MQPSSFIAYISLVSVLFVSSSLHAIDLSKSLKQSSKYNATWSTTTTEAQMDTVPSPTKSVNPKYDSMQKMNLVKTSSKTAPANNDKSVGLYRLRGPEDGITCILMSVDALISVNFQTKLNEKEEGDEFVPAENKIKVTGDCSADNGKQSLVLLWKSFQLSFEFAKNAGGERWYINRIYLSFNSDDLLLHSTHPKTRVDATNDKGILFPTPSGHSFKCPGETVIVLTDRRFPDLKIRLSLRELQVEPFIYKESDFGPEYECSAGGSFQSETAPFIFGSLLTIASLFTIAGYAIYRYMKVNKVQYDTMQ